MPALSFSGSTKLGPFWRLIRQGIKYTTMRRPRARPIQPGDRLYLYWKQRTPRDKKEVHYIADALCEGVLNTRYGEFAMSDDIVRSEGFSSRGEMWEWFGYPKDHAEDRYDMITFRPWPYCPICGAILSLDSYGIWKCTSDECYDDMPRTITGVPFWYKVAMRRVLGHRLPSDDRFDGEGRVTMAGLP